SRTGRRSTRSCGSAGTPRSRARCARGTRRRRGARADHGSPAEPRLGKRLALATRGAHDLSMWRKRDERLDPNEILKGIAQMVMPADAKLDHVIAPLEDENGE